MTIYNQFGCSCGCNPCKCPQPVNPCCTPKPPCNCDEFRACLAQTPALIGSIPEGSSLQMMGLVTDICGNLQGRTISQEQIKEFLMMVESVRYYLDPALGDPGIYTRVGDKWFGPDGLIVTNTDLLAILNAITPEVLEEAEAICPCPGSSDSEILAALETVNNTLLMSGENLTDIEVLLSLINDTLTAPVDVVDQTILLDGDGTGSATPYVQHSGGSVGKTYIIDYPFKSLAFSWKKTTLEDATLTINDYVYIAGSGATPATAGYTNILPQLINNGGNEQHSGTRAITAGAGAQVELIVTI